MVEIRVIVFHFPRIEVIHTLDEADCHCDHCQGQLEVMSQITSEQLELIPLTVKVIRPIKQTYHCPTANMALKPQSFPLNRFLAILPVPTLACYDKSQFHFNWERQVATCPSGKQSMSWLKNTYPQNGTVWEARFSRKDCTPCPSRSRCTRSKKEPRSVGLQSREHHEALQNARAYQTTEAFHQRYAARAGIEATHGQAVRRSGLRRNRYIGLDKTRLQHLATAAATNLIRLGEWLAGTPRAQTRCSHFAALQTAA